MLDSPDLNPTEISIMVLVKFIPGDAIVSKDYDSGYSCYDIAMLRSKSL